MLGGMQHKAKMSQQNSDEVLIEKPVKNKSSVLPFKKEDASSIP
jgi:hypothetical protein